MEWVILVILAVAFLFWLHSKQKRPKSKETIIKCANGVYDVYSANRDIVKGYRFLATLQLRTPLKILELHNTIHKGLESKPPNCNQADGIWLPELKSWDELGIKGLKEFPESTIASDVGPIPESGGVYLEFLKSFRQIVESNKEIEQKCAEILNLGQINKKFDEYLAKHQDLQPDRLPKFLHKLRIRELIEYEKEESLAYAMRISDIVPDVTKLDTLASRYRTTHEGAGGCGLLAAKESNNYQEIAEYLHKQYLERFVDISSRLIEKAGVTTSQRKTQKAKISIWLKTKDQIISGSAQFQYDLPGLKEAVDDLMNKIDEKIAVLNE